MSQVDGKPKPSESTSLLPSRPWWYCAQGGEGADFTLSGLRLGIVPLFPPSVPFCYSLWAMLGGPLPPSHTLGLGSHLVTLHIPSSSWHLFEESTRCKHIHFADEEN